MNREKSSLSDLTDEQLQDVLSASVMSYHVYLEESLSIEEHLLHKQVKNSEMLNYLWDIRFKQEVIPMLNTPSQNFGELIAPVIKDFTDRYLEKNRDLVLDVMENKKKLYKIIFPNKEKYEIDFLAKRDAEMVFCRTVVEYLKNDLKVLPSKISARLDIENHLKRIDHNFTGLTASESQYVSEINVNRVKAFLVAKSGLDVITPIKNKYLGIPENGRVDSIEGKALDYSFKDGVISLGFNGEEKGTSFLAAFTEENGEQVLNISFRGTEAKAKSVAKYALYDFQNMERHYNNITPLLERIIAKAQENATPEKPLKVKLSGHSLGAAMVEKFLEKHQDQPNIRYTAVAIASPGSLHKAQSIINGVDNVANFLNFKTTSFLRDITSLTTSIAIGLPSKFLRRFHFMAIGSKVLDTLFPYKDKDDRLISIKHENDIVPKVGTLVYRVQKEQIILKNENQEETMKDHKIYNYYNEIAEEVFKRETMYQKNAMLFAIEKSIQEKPYLKTLNAPDLINLTMKKVSDRITQIRTQLAGEDNFTQFSKIKA